MDSLYLSNFIDRLAAAKEGLIDAQRAHREAPEPTNDMERRLDRDRRDEMARALGRVEGMTDEIQAVAYDAFWRLMGERAAKEMAKQLRTYVGNIAYEMAMGRDPYANES